MPEVIINSQQSLDAFIEHTKMQWDQHKFLRVSVKTGKQRSPTMNRCLHLYCQLLADALNDGGLDFRETLKEGVDVPWSMEMVKDHLWRHIQVVVTKKESTVKPTNAEYKEIYEILNRHISSKFGIYVPWPNKSEMIGS